MMNSTLFFYLLTSARYLISVMDETFFTLVIEVVGEKGEECISVNQVSSTDLEVITTIIEDIRDHGGWYPCGEFYRSGPTIRDLYRHHAGWEVFNSLLPQPPSGFALVASVKLFGQELCKIDMV